MNKYVYWGYVLRDTSLIIEQHKWLCHAYLKKICELDRNSFNFMYSKFIYYTSLFLTALFILVTYHFVSVSVVHNFVVLVVHLSDLKSVQYFHEYNCFCQHWSSYAIKNKSLDSFVCRVAITFRWLVIKTEWVVLSILRE